MLKQIPPVTRNLLYINVIIFMVQQVLNQQYGVGPYDDFLSKPFGLHFYLADDFGIWQLFTYMFLHGSWTHVLLNMFSLWMFGRIIEHTMGSKKFLIYYIICGMGAGLCQELWQTGEYFYLGLNGYDNVNTGVEILSMGQFLSKAGWQTIGASGAVYGILLAFGMTFPNERIVLLFPPIPMKAKYFVIGFAVIEAFSAFCTNSNVAHFAHLGGMFFGYLLFRYWRKQDSRSRFTNWNEYARRQPDGSYGTKGRGTMQTISAWFQNLGASLENAFRSFIGIFKSNKKNDGYNRKYTNPDHEYNARRNAEKKVSKEQQERIDRILDKVRRSGYDSLTEEEKRDLFTNNK